ncbi:MAG: D-glucuronyl C5-epimerase family protein, partial [Candidatus Bathyarchaeia archaeon]
WEYPFPWPSYNLSEGWIGSLSQAGILKVFLLAYQFTNDEKYLVAAKKNLNAFSTDFGDGGLRVARIDNGGVYYWYPEYASNDPPYVLNGFITALLWIKEFYDVTGYAQAKKVYENGLEGLIHYLPSYDDSGWSYYDGIGHTSSEHYHKMHVTQLQSLYNVTGYPIFLHYNERWKEGKIDKPTNSSQVWIEIHDVGANYDLDELKKVITTLEKYPGAYDRIVLFVIPNYGDENPFHESPEFSDYIKTLESSGYLLGQHGYTHDGREFAVDREDAEDIVKLGIGEFFLSGFKDPKIFLAPRWNYTEESIGVAQRYFDEVYMDNGIYFEDTFTRYLVHEYTNSSIRMDYKAQLEQAKKDYGESKGIFRLSMHLKFASSQDHLDFLDEFLPWIESGKN